MLCYAKEFLSRRSHPMCGRFVLMTQGKDLAERFGLEEVPDLEPRYNIAPTQMVVVIRVDRNALQRQLVQMKWGLIPFWAKDASIEQKMINARVGAYILFVSSNPTPHSLIEGSELSVSFIPLPRIW